MRVPAGGTDDPKFPVDFFENVRCITAEVRLAGDIVHAGELCLQSGGGRLLCCCVQQPSMHMLASSLLQLQPPPPPSPPPPDAGGFALAVREQAPCLHAKVGVFTIHVSLSAETRPCLG